MPAEPPPRDRDAPGTAYPASAGAAFGANDDRSARRSPGPRNQVRAWGPPGAMDGPGTGSRRPGPDARSLSRPRITAVAGWIAIVGIGVLMVSRGVSADELGFLIFGGCWTVLLGAGLLSLFWTRVVVDGDRLFVRGPAGWQPPLDLTRLTYAAYGYEANYARSVRLRDADGHAVRLDPVNHRLTPLYRELAARLGPWDAALTGRLADTVGRHR